MCVTNCKLYFGITSGPLNLRIRKHFERAERNAKGHFQFALRKHGRNNFVWYEIGRTLTWEDACDVEKILIAYFHTLDSKLGYNSTAGGDGTVGLRATEDTKLKMRMAKLGKKCPESAKLKLKVYHTGRKRSEEDRSKMSAAHIGKPAHNKGKSMPEEQRQKLLGNKNCLGRGTPAITVAAALSEVAVLGVDAVAKKYNVSRSTVYYWKNR